MVETNNWITPQLEKGVPFWGKPPLSFWATAAFLKTGLPQAFAARLPHFIFGLACLWLVWVFTKRIRNKESAIWAFALLATSIPFLLLTGGVMTDGSLLLSVTLSLIGFWLAQDIAFKSRKTFGYLFFVGIGLGLLSKGPIALLLIGIPIVLWLLWSRSNWLSVLKSLPWLGGILLLCLIAIPWYYYAERETPGFLEYFIVGEHWKRFTEPKWAGDLYGSAHSQPKGMIWVFWLLFTMPWGVWLAIKGFRAILNKKIRLTKTDKFLVCWMLSPMLFFTLSGNILWTYIATSLPAMVILVAIHFDQKIKPLIVALSIFTGLLIVGASFYIRTDAGKAMSHKALITQFNQMKTNDQSQLYYFEKPTDSAKFYSGGMVLTVKDSTEIFGVLNDSNQDYLCDSR